MACSLTLPKPSRQYSYPLRTRAATLTALVIHLAGAIGIVWLKAGWFIQMTPVNLLAMMMLAWWTEQSLSRSWISFFLLAWAVGMATEMIGVNTGILFGAYHYGTILGPQILGVPLLIGCNWYLILRASSGVATRMLEWLYKGLQPRDISPIKSQTHRWIHPLLGAILATGFDWVMEPIAIRLGYWTWHGDGHVPTLNYLTWFVVSAALLTVSQRFSVSDANAFPSRLYLIQLLFFLWLGWHLS
ncbi:MAG: carotenoid biosynthesis protein [Bacteroidetes bacterium]|nr:carotenoid biosynthesis protein [Bacteroidota bacterium]